MRAAVTTLGGCLIAASLLLAGCGQSESSNPYALPSFDQSASAGAQAAPASTASPTATRRVSPVVPMTAPPTAVHYTPADAYREGAWVERGPSVATTAAQKAAVDAVVKYMTVRVQLSNTWVVDEQALARVAAQQALTTARQRAVDQREADRRSIGRFVVDVSSVSVTGSTATVTGCDFDGTSEVDPNGGVLESPPGGVLITMRLARTGGSWRVVQWPDHEGSACDWTAK
jgi:hypothetical protein